MMTAEHLSMALLSFMVLRYLEPLPFKLDRVRSCLITEISEPSRFEMANVRTCDCVVKAHLMWNYSQMFHGLKKKKNMNFIVRSL